MALVGVDVKETIQYIPEKERGAENPTTFHIGVVTSKESLKLGTGFANANNVGKQAELAWEIIKSGVKKVENVIDPQTKKLTTYDVITDDVLLLFSREIKVILEVAAKVVEFNNLSEQEIKN